MKKTIIISVCVGIAALLAILLFVVILPNSNYEEVRTMEINNVDLVRLEDGIYHGDYAYSQTNYQVDVEIRDHKIADVQIISGGTSDFAKSAQGVIDSMIEEQRIDVDVVSGATTSSKAIMKAVENALAGTNG